MKFVLFGAGRIAYKHADALTQGHHELEFAGVCDVQVERAQKLATQFGVPWAADIEELQAKGVTFDAISILSESGNHVTHAIDLLRFSVPLLIEKPLALTTSDLDKLILRAAENGVPVYEVKQNRYNPEVVAAKMAVEKGEIGPLISGGIRVLWARDQAYYDLDSWRGTRALDGGVLANQAIHHLDLLLWFFGPWRKVFAFAGAFSVDIESEDTAVGVVEFESGAIATILATTAARPTNVEGSLTVVGQNGVIEIGGVAVNEVRYWIGEETNLPNDLLESAATEGVYGAGHRKLYVELVAKLQGENRGHDDFVVSALSARTSVELLDALYFSISTGRPVERPGMFAN